MSDRRWLSVPAASKYFSVKPKTLYSLIGRGRIKGDCVLRLGRAIRLDVKKIEEAGIER